MESNQTPGEFVYLTSLTANNSFLVEFPARMDFFDRYSPVDKGGKNNGVDHGTGDHFVRPEVAAALFGLAAVLKDKYGITISFGDMSAENGTDPWSRRGEDHKGHGHKSRSGVDIDFRYIDKNGNSFQGKMNSSKFSTVNNQAVYDVAKSFGFTENFQGTTNKLIGVATASGHNNHGHLGFDVNAPNLRRVE
ncbi:MAG: hypothetical protein IPN69_08975 [Acidobacteria bacterium]|nr:hypothetical protein [Acidobacteriota bacterium]